jgi:hypothetical protein
MPRIPVRIGQENRVKVLTAFGGRDIPVLATNATNLVGGAATASSLRVEGPSVFIGTCRFTSDVFLEGGIARFHNFYVSGIATFAVGLGNTYGIPYFQDNGVLGSTATPSVGIQSSNLFLTTNELNIPVWTGTIDGGTF